MNWYGAGVRQHDTHRELTGQSEQGTPRAGVLSLDAIIVPGARPQRTLTTLLRWPSSLSVRWLSCAVRLSMAAR